MKPGKKRLPQDLEPALIAPCGMNCDQKIGELGVEAFVESERERWTCPECGGVRCVHTTQCIYCGRAWT